MSYCGLASTSSPARFSPPRATVCSHTITATTISIVEARHNFWELVEKSPLSGVILQVLTEELDGGLVLCKSVFTTEQTTSASVNRYTPYWGSTDMAIRKLNELHRFGWDFVKAKSIPNAPYQGKRKIYRTPTNFEMARWLGPIFLKKATEIRQRPVQHWKIAVRTGHQPLFKSTDADVSSFRWIESPKDHF